MCVHVCSVCPGVCNPLDCSPPGPSVHGIIQARILECVAISSSRGSSWPRDGTCVPSISFIGRWILYQWTTWEAWLFSAGFFIILLLTEESRIIGAVGSYVLRHRGLSLRIWTMFELKSNIIFFPSDSLEGSYVTWFWPIKCKGKMWELLWKPILPNKVETCIYKRPRSFLLGLLSYRDVVFCWSCSSHIATMR